MLWDLNGAHFQATALEKQTFQVPELVFAFMTPEFTVC